MIYRLSEEEVNRILGISNNIKHPIECNYNIGDKLLITKGALENSTGEVTHVDHNSLKMNVNIRRIRIICNFKIH